MSQTHGIIIFMLAIVLLISLYFLFLQEQKGAVYRGIRDSIGKAMEKFSLQYPQGQSMDLSMVPDLGPASWANVLPVDRGVDYDAPMRAGNPTC